MTALFEVVPKGQAIPNVPNAPESKAGDDAQPEDRQVRADDMLLVKVRYKRPGAIEADAAREVTGTLSRSSRAVPFADADADLQWSIATAAFAELLKQSPYAVPDQLEALRDIFAAQTARDIERAEFLDLFDAAVSLLAEQP